MKNKLVVILMGLFLITTIGCGTVKAPTVEDTKVSETQIEESKNNSETLEEKGVTLSEILKSGYAMTGYFNSGSTYEVTFICEVPEEINNEIMSFKGKTISEIRNNYDFEINGYHSYSNTENVFHGKINDVTFYLYLDKETSTTLEKYSEEAFIDYETLEEFQDLVINNIDSIMITVNGKISEEGNKRLAVSDGIMQELEANADKYYVEIKEIEFK